MKVFLLTLLAFGLALAGLALGRLCGRPGWRGSCGFLCHGCEACPHAKEEAKP